MTTTLTTPLWNLFYHDIMNKLGAAKLSFELALMTESQPMELENTLNGMENIVKTYDRFMRDEDDVPLMSLQQIIDEVKKMLGETTVEIKYQEKAKMEFNSLFIAIFYNLVTNSLKHSGLPPNDLIITIEVEKGKITFTDNGQGFGEGTKVFVGGPGHALMIIRKISNLLNFTIRASNSPEGGARFSIRFM